MHASTPWLWRCYVMAGTFLSIQIQTQIVQTALGCVMLGMIHLPLRTSCTSCAQHGMVQYFMMYIAYIRNKPAKPAKPANQQQIHRPKNPTHADRRRPKQGSMTRGLSGCRRRRKQNRSNCEHRELISENPTAPTPIMAPRSFEHQLYITMARTGHRLEGLSRGVVSCFVSRLDGISRFCAIYSLTGMLFTVRDTSRYDEMAIVTSR